MKALIWIVFLIAAMGLLVWSGIAAYQIDFTFDQQAGGYLMLADDASTANLKLQHIKNYRDAVHRIVTGDDARYTWKTPQTKVVHQFTILDSLIERIEQTAKLAQSSLEYQQAMAQITGQEFEGTIYSTNKLFRDAYVRQGGIIRFLAANWIWFFVLLVGLFIVGAIIGSMTQDM